MIVNPAVANRDPKELLPEVASLFLQLQQEMAAGGHPIFLVEGYRAPERQDWLYGSGRERPGPIVTNARAWHSWHQTRRAFDVAFDGPVPFGNDHPWLYLGECGEQLGLEWGGRWTHPDRPHFQLTGGLSLAAAVLDERRRAAEKIATEVT